MPLLSNMELRGMERGKEIGALQNARASVKTVLTIRFGEVSLEIDGSLKQVSDLSVLNELLKLAVTVNSLEDFRHFIGSRSVQS